MNFSLVNSEQLDDTLYMSHTYRQTERYMASSLWCVCLINPVWDWHTPGWCRRTPGTRPGPDSW